MTLVMVKEAIFAEVTLDEKNDTVPETVKDRMDY